MSNKPFKKVIDFSQMQQMKKDRAKSKKRVVVLVVAVISAVLLLVGTILFFQINEVVDDKDFWQNFNSSHATA